jgi:predicted small lipoprotein YifL
MKKVFSLLLVLLFVFTLTGCGCSRKEKEPEPQKEEEPALADDELLFDGILYKFNKTEKHYGISYKVSENMRLWDSGNAYNYFSVKHENEVDAFIIRVFYYKNKSVAYAIKDTTDNVYESKTSVKLDGRKYTKVHLKNPGGATTYLFYYKHKKDVYAYCFTSLEEVERLESIFLKSVKYK